MNKLHTALFIALKGDYLVLENILFAVTKNNQLKIQNNQLFSFDTSEWSCYNCLWMVKFVYAFPSQLLIKYAICIPHNLVIKVYVFCFLGSSVLCMNGIFIGYSSTRNSYRVYSKRLMTVEKFVHVVLMKSIIQIRVLQRIMQKKMSRTSFCKSWNLVQKNNRLFMWNNQLKFCIRVEDSWIDDKH